MSWRVVNITRRAKLDLQLGHLVVRGEETVKIHLSELAVLIIENTAVSLTAALLSELTKRKVKVIFCDEKRLPESELMPLHGSHDSADRFRRQAAWGEPEKAAMWAAVIREKIVQQGRFLAELGYPEETARMEEYAAGVQPGDATNREGPAAKVYFNTLYGMAFSRRGSGEDDAGINAALNYGYAILLSAVSREITACGYAPQLGLHHCNTFNAFNLASDLMEPFRILVDRTVYALMPEELGREEKTALAAILTREIVILGQRQTVLNAIRIFVRRVLDAVEGGAADAVPGYTVPEGWGEEQ